MGAHNPVVGAGQGFRAPSWDQESVRDSGHEDSASARISAGQRPRPSFRHPQDVDLVWAWAKKWGTYAERRAEVAKIITPLLDRLDDLEHSGTVIDWGVSPVGWSELEQRLSGLRNEMDHATSLDHYQDVGRRCREVLIDVVNLVFTPDMVPDGQEQAKASDAKARFGYVIQACPSGRSRTELRKLMRAAWDLAQKVTHGDTTRVDAFAAAQSTLLIVRTLAEIHREDRPG